MSLIHTIQDLLFPRRCVGCRAYDEWLCAACVRAHRLVEHVESDSAAQQETGIDSITTLGPYSDPVWRMSVGNLKFHGVLEFADVLGELLASVVPMSGVSDGGVTAVLVPIPLHPRRKRARGYNQSALIADAVSRRTGIPVAHDLIQRARNTQTQTALDHGARRANLDDAFELVQSRPGSEGSADAAQTQIILVDDVITTGATMCAAARTLRTIKPASVHLLAVARGE